MTQKPQLLIVTGMSGAGRSTVGNALEDQGWYVVDNLPPQLLPTIAELFTIGTSPIAKMAAIIDVRGGAFFEELLGNVQAVRTLDVDVQVLFLEATDLALVKRFENVRRPHPLQGNGTLLDGIGAERKRLLSLRDSGDVVIDTSDLNIHQLSNKIAESFGEPQSKKLNLTIMSFGFKYGIPADADMVADARFIPNPFWIESLRPFTGEDNEVSEYVLSQAGVRDFIGSFVDSLKPVFEGYLKENKRYATVAIGCTGGKHRSVALVREIAQLCAEIGEVHVSVKHRDLGRE